MLSCSDAEYVLRFSRGDCAGAEQICKWDEVMSRCRGSAGMKGVQVQIYRRCKGAEVVRRWCRGAGECACSKHEQSRCRGAGVLEVQVQLHRCRGVEVWGPRYGGDCAGDCACAEQVQRCRGAEVQRCRGAEQV